VNRIKIVDLDAVSGKKQDIPQTVDKEAPFGNEYPKTYTLSDATLDCAAM
jgi:hypothetical protein